MTDNLVMYAILALDAYNEDPATSQLNVPLTGGELGGASLLDNLALALLPSDYAATGFYATAYDWGGQIVISYRGTLTQIFGTEVWNGYTTGTGFPFGYQASDAIQFFHNVAMYADPSLLPGGADASDWQSANIQVTGHSLGGGLAGFVGAIYGQTGVLFDNMTFNDAVDNAYYAAWASLSARTSTPTWAKFLYGAGTHPYAPDFSHLSAYAVKGELLEVGLLGRTQQIPPVNFLNSYSGYGANVVNLHSQALLTLLIYAQGKSPDWQSIGGSLYNAYFNNAIGTAVGFKQGAAGANDATGQGAPASQMLAAIAYSALDSGGMPFGNTGIVSLFADADTLGGLQAAGKFTGLISSSATNPFFVGLPFGTSPVGALTEIAVQFAADQAAATNTDQALAQGAITKLDGSTLKIDLAPTKWTKTFQQQASSSATTAILGVGDLFDSVLANVSAQLSPGELTSSWISSNLAGFSERVLKQLNEITEIDLSLDSGPLSATGSLAVAHDGQAGGAMLIGSIGQGSITGSSQGNDIIIGGATVVTGNGKDIILAGGTEAITLGQGNNLILSDTSSLNLTITYSGGAVGASDGGAGGGQSGGPPPATASKGTDVIIGTLSGSDTFTFTDAERAAFTVVWGGSGNDRFNINTTSDSNVNVVELNMSGIRGGNLADLDAKKLQADIDQKYGLSPSQATIVILNPSASDTIYYNGKKVDTPTAALSYSYWENHYSTNGPIPNDYFYQHFSLPWSNVFTTSGSSYALVSANFAYGYSLTNASTRQVSIQPIVHEVVTESGQTINPTTSLDGLLHGFQRLTEGSTSYLRSTSASTLNLINYNPGDFGIGLPENGLGSNGTQKETLYDQFGNVITNSTEQASPSDFYEPGFADASHNRPTVNLGNYLLGSSASDPTNVSTAFFAENKALLDGQFYGFTVLDTAANVSSALDALSADSKLTGITLTDSAMPTLTLTVGQLSADAAALSKITNLNFDIAINDTAAAVSGVFDAINADASISAIHLTDGGVPSLSLTVAQTLYDTAAFAKIANVNYTVVVSDTAAAVAANIDALNSNLAVNSITLLDGGTPALTLTVDQLLGDTRALGEITNAAYTVTVEDNAAKILANASALSAIGSVTGAIVVDTAANVLNNAAAIGADTQVKSITVIDAVANIFGNLAALQSQPQPTSLVVVDTVANILNNSSEIASATGIKGIGVLDAAANVAANIDALNADVSIGWIELTDGGTPAIILTAGEAANNTGVFARIVNTSYAIDVLDTAAAVAANADALSKVAALAQITLTGPGTPTLTLAAAQAVNDAGVIAAISNTNAQVVIADSAANLVAHLDALNADQKISSITLTDAGTPTLTLSVAQLLADASVLGKIANANVQILVSDTAANISANFDALGGNAALSSIALTGNGTPTLVLNAAQVVNSPGLLAKISNSGYAVAVLDSVTGVLANAGALAAQGHVSSITAMDSVGNILAHSSALTSAGVTTQLIVDSAANVAANIDAIEVASSIHAISLTDIGTPTLNLTVGQTIDDATAIGLIVNSTFAIAVHGSAAEVSASIGLLAANNLIGAVTLTDAGIPTLSLNAGEAAGDTDFFAKLTNADYVLAVTDTAAEVSANLDALSANAAVGAITLSDVVAPQLDLTVAQALSDTTALSLITNAAYTIAVRGSATSVVENAAAIASDPHIVSISIIDNAANVLAAEASLADNPLVTSIRVVDTAANIIANESALTGISGITAVEVVDTAANVAANLDALKENSSISKITLTDANPVLILTAEQAASDYSAFSNITNPAYAISVVDTAAAVSQYLGQIAFNEYLTSITLTDSGTPALSLYSYVLDSGVLSKITNASYTFSLLGASSVSVSTFVDNRALLDQIAGGFSVSDYALNVGAYLDALNSDPHLSSITFSDFGTPDLALSAAQALADTQALGKITNSSYTISVTGSVGDILAGSSVFAANSRIASLTVQDTAANVLSNAAVLEANPGLSAIIIVDGAANILASEAALAALSVPLTIKVNDSAANVSGQIDQLNADTAIGTISLTDANNPTLTLTVSQAVNDSGALGKIAGPAPYVPASYGIAISDTAVNVSASLSALRAITEISSISLTDAQQLSLTLNAIDALADQGVLARLTNATYSVAVVDTAANIQTDIDALNLDPNISSITVQDADVINVTAEQAARDAVVLGKLVNATVNVVNTSNISVAEFLTNRLAIDSIPANFSVLDTAENVSSSLTAFNGDASLSAITLSDIGVPTLHLTAAEAVGDVTALGKIVGPYTIVIQDTAANVAAQFSALENISQISTITLTDSGQPTLALGAVQSSAAVIGISSSGSWTITIGGKTEALRNVARVQFADKTFELVDQFGTGLGGYQSVQSAIDQASGGETILIAPGTYTESTTTPYSGVAGGFFINKPNLTLQGVKADGSLITSAADARSFGPTIISGAETDFGSNLFIGPDGTGAVLEGLHLAAGTNTTNKLLEFWANNVSIENNFIDTSVNGADTGAAAIYINVAGSPIAQYLIAGNILNEGIYVANGVGTAGQGISTTQVISNNVFEGSFDQASGNGRYDMVAVQGRIPGVAWQPDSAQVPTVEGNTRVDNATPFIFRMTEADPSLFPSASQVATILAQNADAATSYAYVLNADGSLHLVDRDNGAGPFKTLYVANGIETLNLGLTAPNALYGSYRDTMVAGDTIVVQSVGHTVNDITVDDLTVQATANSSDLNLNLSAGVRSITLADYASGLGANVNVTGNDLGDTISGNSGNNKLTGGTGSDILIAGLGSDLLTGGGGYDVYRLGPAFGQTQISNFATDGTTSPRGEVDFGSGATDEKLWFVQNGNDLQVELLGTSDQLTIAGWYANNRAQVESFKTVDGLQLDNQISQLVSAMATYAAANPAFNPASATQMPNDGALQGAISAAWHS